MATQIYPTFSESAGETGAVREFWVKITGLKGAASSATVINTVENPFQEDVMIHEALLVITTASGSVAAGLDIGIANNVDGGGAVTLLATDLDDTELDTAPQVLEIGIAHSVSAPPLRSIWKAPNADHDATGSWIAFALNASVAAGDLRYNCLLKVIPYADLI